MAFTSFQLVDDQTFLPADVVNGKVFESADQFNGTGTDLSTGIRVTIDYHDLQATSSGPTLQAIVESKSLQGQYSVLAYQFEEFGVVGVPLKIQIIMAPNLNWPDAGVENIIFVGGSTVEKVSNQTGFLTGTWRVSVLLKDPSSRFTSLRMSIYGERFSELVLPVEFNNIITDQDGSFVTTEVV